MSDYQTTRREVMRQTLMAGAVLAAGGTQLRAAQVGPNDTIRVGMIGCGGRNHWHTNWIAGYKDKLNVKIAAVCDIWKQRREGMAKLVEDKFGSAPVVHHDYHRILEAKDIDAVVIGTPDHQHCPMLIEAVGAGKDVYIEKPIALAMDELNKAYDAVKASRSIVQHGTQGRNCPGAATARDFIQAGKLGKLIRVEQSRSFYNAYWNFMKGPDSEADTDWKAFLYNRPMRPFDADIHGAWMGYQEFSSGPVGGWMSHMSDLIHFVTGCGFPRFAVCQGGIYSPTSDKRRTAPDNVTALLEYPEGFVTSFTTHFGNGYNDYITFFGTQGIMRTGAPDGHPDGIKPIVSGEGSDHPDKIKEQIALDNTTAVDNMANWLECIRTRKQPNTAMDAGYKHGVAVIMADMAMVKGCKMTFDETKREIRPA